MHDMHNMTPPTAEPAVGGHGMLLIGTTPAYLSHLPMFMAPHNFQVILQVTFTGSDDPHARYIKDRQQTGTKLYTFSPAEKWDINDLAADGPRHQPKRASFDGTIWRNHFEDHPVTHPGERHRIGDAVANVERVIRFQKFMPQVTESSLLSYVLFGQGQELFLAHVITRPPDFDQVLSVRIDDLRLSAEEMSQGVAVTIPDRTNSVANRVQEGERLVGKVQRADSTHGDVIELQLEVGTEYYIETEDLAEQM